LLGNWNSTQLAEEHSAALLPSDSSEGITAVLLDVSRTVVIRMGALWEARKLAK